MALLLLGGRREGPGVHVPRIERCDQALDRSSLAGSVPALEQHADRWSEAAVAELAGELEPQRQQPSLSCSEALLLLGARKAEAEIELRKPAPGSLSSHSGVLTASSLLSAAWWGP